MQTVRSRDAGETGSAELERYQGLHGVPRPLFLERYRSGCGAGGFCVAALGLWLGTGAK